MLKGTSVICTDASYPTNPKAIQHKYWVKQNQKYTVREPVYRNGKLVGLLLEEIVNPKVFDHIAEAEFEPGFAIWRFKKQESLTDVE